MFQHWVLAVLVVSVPAQYLLSKYWTTKGTTYYLQKTFSSLDEKLQLREWSMWPDKWLQCAKKFIFDYKGHVEERQAGADEDEMQEAGHSATTTKTDDKSKKSPAKRKDGNYDPAVHFGTSRHPPRSPRHPDAQLYVGQVVRNTKHGYRGVIIGWDARPIVPKKLESAIFPKNQPELLEQPWYAVLVDTRDRLVPQMDYAPQRDLQLLFNSVIIHPVLHEYFEIGPLQDSRYRLRPFFRAIYPED